jgi:hypothetical protein
MMGLDWKGRVESVEYMYVPVEGGCGGGPKANNPRRHTSRWCSGSKKKTEEGTGAACLSYVRYEYNTSVRDLHTAQQHSTH